MDFKKCQRIYRGKHMPLLFNKKAISNSQHSGKAVDEKKIENHFYLD